MLKAIPSGTLWLQPGQEDRRKRGQRAKSVLKGRPTEIPDGPFALTSNANLTGLALAVQLGPELSQEFPKLHHAAIQISSAKHFYNKSSIGLFD